MPIDNVVNAVKADVSWVKTYERIILVTLVLAAGAWGWSTWVNSDASAKRAQAAVLSQQVADLKTQNAAIALQAAQSAAVYQATVEALTQQNASLAAAVTQRNAILGEQQTHNTAAPLPELAQRWAELAKIAPETLAATPTGISVSDTSARMTVNLLEEVPVLRADLADTETIAVNRQTELDKADGLITSLNAEVTGLKTLGTAEGKKCAADIAVVKADARKSKRNWFIKGVTVGAAVAVFIVLHY